MIMLGFLAVAAVTDILTHRISNLLLFTCFVMELAVHITVHPQVEPEPLGLSCCFVALLFVLFVLGMLGGADVKIYALCVFTYPDSRGLRLITVSVLLSAVYSAYVLIRHGLVRERAVCLYNFIMSLACGIRTAYPGVERGGLDTASSLQMDRSHNSNCSREEVTDKKTTNTISPDDTLQHNGMRHEQHQSSAKSVQQDKAIIPMAVFIFLAACIVLI